MKTKSTMFAAFTLKALVVPTIFILGFLNFTTCDAQSIVGKWKGISMRFFYTAEGAKARGKQVQENSIAEIGNVIVEYKSDHSFITTTSAVNETKVNTLGGIWTLTGDQLKVTVDPKYNPRKGRESSTSTISITGNTMVMTENTPPNKMVSKTETTYARM